jgi:hypothetical protein
MGSYWDDLDCAARCDGYSPRPRRIGSRVKTVCKHTEKKRPIRKKVLRKVYRYFCPDCGKQMETHDMSGGHGGGGIYWKCPDCDLYLDKD